MHLLRGRLRWNWGEYYNVKLKKVKATSLGSWALDYEFEIFGPNLTGTARSTPIRPRTKKTHGESQVQITYRYHGENHLITGILPDDSGIMAHRMVHPDGVLTKWTEKTSPQKVWFWILRRDGLYLTREVESKKIIAYFHEKKGVLEVYPTKENALLKTYKILSVPIKHYLSMVWKFWQRIDGASIKELPAEMHVGEVLSFLILKILI